MQFPQSRYRAGYARRAMSDEAQLWDDFAICIEIHIACGCRGRRLAKIEEIRLAFDVERCEATATEIACFGKSDRECEANGYRGIDGIATRAQDLFGDGGSGPIGCSDRSHIGAGRDGKQQRAKQGEDRGVDELE